MASQAARGKQAMDAGNYEQAIEEFTAAIKESPTSPDFFIQRATAYQRAKKYEEALADGDQAVLNAQKRAKREAIIEGQFRRGVALLTLGRNADAEFILQRVKALDPKHKQADMFLNKAKFGLKSLSVDDERRKVTITETPTPKAAGSSTNGASAPAPPKPSAQPPALAAASQTPADKIRYEWYQNTENIYFTLLAKAVPKEKIQVEVTARSMSVSFPLQNGSSYDLTLEPLFAPVISEKSITRVMPTKVEIILIKKTPGQKWSALESKEPIEVPKADAPTSSITPTCDETVKRAVLSDSKQSGPAYPTSSKSGPKNWDTLLNEGDNKDLDELDEGGDPANAFFKKLFKGADPDTQRAMMKSYVESNGTALSTNWSEVSQGPVKTEPPEGMEAKAWGK